MKKILSALLLLFAMLLSACGGIKYEFKDGILYADGKEASGTFEFNLNGFKAKGTFVNGLADGLFERYYPDGSIMVKDTFSNGNYLKDEIYYKNGQLMADFSNEKGLNLFYDDGQLVMASNPQTGETIAYHENGNPLLVIGGTTSTLYNENNEVLFKIENGESVETGATLNKLEDGSFELVKNGKVIAKIDANGQILTSLYSTGEILMVSNTTSESTEIFFKNGQTFFKGDGVNSRFYYKDGVPLYESNGGEWKFFDREGKQIISNFDNITDVKKLN